MAAPLAHANLLERRAADGTRLVAAARALARSLRATGQSDEGATGSRRRLYDAGTVDLTAGTLSWAPGDGVDAEGHELLVYRLSRRWNPDAAAEVRAYRRIGRDADTRALVLHVLDGLHGLHGGLVPGGMGHRLGFRLHVIGYAPAPGERVGATPDLIHRDDVDWTAIVLLGREYVHGGENLFYGLENVGRRVADAVSAPVARVLLERPFDAVLWDDRAVGHYVTPVSARSGGAAQRTVLVVDLWART